MVGVRVQRHHFPLRGVEHQLIQECVVGSNKALDINVWHHQIHLQVLTHLSDHLRERDERKTQVVQMVSYLSMIQTCRNPIKKPASFVNLEYVGVLGEPQQFTSLAQTDAVERGQIIAA